MNELERFGFTFGQMHPHLRMPLMTIGFLIIQQPRHPDRAVHIPPEGLLIGRGEDAGLCLPNASVSRHHARLVIDGRRVFVEDLSSDNGTVVNQHLVAVGTRQELGNNDTIQFGTFKVIYLSNVVRSLPKWRGRPISQVPAYTVSKRPQDDKTFGLDKATLIRMAESDHRCDTAHLIQQGSDGRRWKPGDQELFFGRTADILVPGWLIAARVASISWGNGYHVLRPISWWTRVRLNGSNLSDLTRLHNGARLRIGRLHFRYEIPPSDHIKKMYGGTSENEARRRETFTIPKKR